MAAGTARALTKDLFVGVSKAAAVCAALPTVLVPIIGLSAAVGLPGALNLDVPQEAFGLCLGGWLLGLGAHRNSRSSP